MNDDFEFEMDLIGLRGNRLRIHVQRRVVNGTEANPDGGHIWRITDSVGGWMITPGEDERRQIMAEYERLKSGLARGDLPFTCS